MSFTTAAPAAACKAWYFVLFIENGEDIQVLRYEPGQKYDPHYDYFADKVNIARGGHRIVTVLMYLSDVEKGGETVFPSAEVSIFSLSIVQDNWLSLTLGCSIISAISDSVTAYHLPCLSFWNYLLELSVTFLALSSFCTTGSTRILGYGLAHSNEA